MEQYILKFIKKFESNKDIQVNISHNFNVVFKNNRNMCIRYFGNSNQGQKILLEIGKSQLIVTPWDFKGYEELWELFDKYKHLIPDLTDQEVYFINALNSLDN